jgi:lipoyl(octanoyl) transferase
MAHALASFVPIWLGRRAYQPAFALQERLNQARVDQEIGDILLLLEHPLTITLGSGAKPDNIRASDAELQQWNVAKIKSSRGGDVTFHGPGQLVGYPIVDLRPDRCDVRKYVRNLSEVMIRLANEYGLGAGTMANMIGTWIDQTSPNEWPGENRVGKPVKIGAIGVRLAHWVTMHGFAFNGSTELDLFRTLIVPCGLKGYDITSLQELLGSSTTVQTLAQQCAPVFAQVFDAKAHPIVDVSNLDDSQLPELLLNVGRNFRPTNNATLQNSIFVYFQVFRLYFLVRQANHKRQLVRKTFFCG